MPASLLARDETGYGRNVRVAITGAGGFIGSHVVEGFLAAGHEVRAMVRYVSHGGWGWLEPLRGTDLPLEVVPGDVTDAAVVRDLHLGVDAAVHLAALIGIPYSYRAPESYVAVNVIGTLNVLEAARTAAVGRVVLTSTSEVYGSALYTPIDESHPRQAQSPYSATKIAADALAEAWFRTYGVPAVVLRPFNTYGPRQSPRAVIPAILGQLLAGCDELRLGRVDPARDFTFVTDTAAAFVAAATVESLAGEVVQLGSGAAITVGDLARLCMEVCGRSVPIRLDDHRLRPEASEVNELVSDPTKAHRVLGWKPQVPLVDGLRLTAESLASTTLRTEYAL